MSTRLFPVCTYDDLASRNPRSSAVIRIDERTVIPASTITYTFAASPGPGGQNVNKLATKATLWFELANCPTLSEFQKARIASLLRNRIGLDGRMRVSSSQHRTQAANRAEALQKFVILLRGALKPVKIRRKTKPSRSSQLRRVETKRHRGAVKATRRNRGNED